jgi:predicted nucleic acid-binding protein
MGCAGSGALLKDVMKAILESDVLIDYLQGVPQAADELGRYRQPHYSIITFMELHCGAGDEAGRRGVDTLLGRFKGSS